MSGKFFCCSAYVAAIFCTEGLLAQTSSGLQRATAEMKYWNIRGRTLGYEANYYNFPGQIRFGTFSGASILPVIKHEGRGKWHYPFLHRSYNGGIFVGNCCTQFGSTVGADPAKNLGGTVKTDPREPLGLNVMSGILEYSENPLIQAGSYMAVLATEWHLLAQDGSVNYSLAGTDCSFNKIITS
jgi:hypothetical protein